MIQYKGLSYKQLYKCIAQSCCAVLTPHFLCDYTVNRGGCGSDDRRYDPQLLRCACRSVLGQDDSDTDKDTEPQGVIYHFGK